MARGNSQESSPTPSRNEGSYSGHDNPNHSGTHSHDQRSGNASSSGWGQSQTRGENRSNQSRQPKAPGW